MDDHVRFSGTKYEKGNTVTIKCGNHYKHGARRLRTVLPYIVCFFVLCNRHWFNRSPGPDQVDRTGVSTLRFELRRSVTELCLPLALLGARVGGFG
jgi:hypothetical protein